MEYVLLYFLDLPATVPDWRYGTPIQVRYGRIRDGGITLSGPLLPLLQTSGLLQHRFFKVFGSKGIPVVCSKHEGFSLRWAWCGSFPDILIGEFAHIGITLMSNDCGYSMPQGSAKPYIS
jgi:hypothetical protein